MAARPRVVGECPVAHNGLPRAKAMAEAGADFREILAHYYPNTVTITLGSAAPLHRD
ncbi:MAG TPA: hypothetical protein VK302_22545 [Terriglobales bacterium]|nr:hypothetical protein [Terriglobales bacterium]